MAPNIAVALKTIRGSRRPIVLAAMIMLMLGFAGITHAGVTQCSNPVSFCPCGIRSGGIYVLDSNLAPTSAGSDCIHINASNVTLDLGNYTITGNPEPYSALGGMGIWILPGTTGVSVTGTGSTSVISQFKIGVEVDGANAALEDVEADNNHAGIKFNGPGAFGSNLTTDYNQKNGIVALPSAIAPYLTNLTADANQGSGVKLSGTKGGFVAVVEASSNGGYGVWLSSARFNTLADFTLSKNTWAGVYLGCYREGDVGSVCPAGYLPSSNNIITSVSSDPSSVTPGVQAPSYGIAISVGNSYNRVIQVSATGSSPGTYEAIDANPDCGTDLWLNNTFTLTNPSGCIH